MTLSKQLNVFPMGVEVTVVEGDVIVMCGKTSDLKDLLKSDLAHASAYVSKVLPVEKGKSRIVIKTKSKVRNKED